MRSSPPGTVVELLRGRAGDQPDRLAYTFLLDGETAEARVTYGEIDARARAIAARLQRLVRPGERVLLLYPPGLSFIGAFFGCLYAGAVAVPAYPPHGARLERTLPRLLGIARDARPVAALTTTALLPLVERFRESAEDVLTIRVLDTEEVGAEGAEEWRAPAIGPGTLAFLQYTSGSTGTPRGVMLAHGNLLHNEAVIQKAFGHTEESIGVGWLPVYHDMGLIGNLLQSLYVGMPCILLAPAAFLQRPARWLEAVSRYRATTSGGPNFAYDLCARKITTEERGSLDLSRWTVAFTGAEPIRAETLERFAEAFAPCGFRREAFYPCYGLAEATLFVTGGQRGVEPVVRFAEPRALGDNEVALTAEAAPGSVALVSCGRSAADQTVVIVDPETGQVCPSDRVGEIWISGPSVGLGYWDRPEESEATFGARLAETGDRPYLRSGDLGFLADGQLFVTGRLKDLLIIRGRNHYPQDIEATVEHAHSGLRPAAGAACSVEVDGEERLVIVQELERQLCRARPEELEAVLQAIRTAVTEQHELEVYAIRLVQPGVVPKTSSGKIQRHACRARFLAARLDPVAEWTLPAARTRVPSDGSGPPAEPVPGLVPASAAVRPQTVETIQAWLLAQLARQLSVDPRTLDPRAPFSRYGLDSLAAVTMSGDLQDWLGRPLSPTLAWEYPTPLTLARFLAGAEQPHASGEMVGGLVADPAEPIAIIGIGCRFPGAEGPAAFWDLLRNGIDAISEVPPDRWNLDEFYDPDPAAPGKMNTRWGGFIDGIDQFEPDFFGIAPREAVRIDPQQRLLLEVAWEALEDAGQIPERLASSATGVFIGISTNDYGRRQLDDPYLSDAYAGTGSALSIAANRISYLLDLRGPSMAIDTACSSSLVAVHVACQSIWSGESTLALAGGVNLILAPAITVNFTKSGYTSPDGRCKAFDSRANGYVRGEGAGIVVLKPLARARVDGDPIYAVIRGSAVNQDGRSNGLTAPNPQAQQAVLREAYRRARVSPAEVQYVEAHGTGTRLGDPIEAGALGAVLGAGRPRDRACIIGSVKTNFGHLEAAAGIAGLIKVALSLKHREIPPSLHFLEPNPHIPFDELGLVVQQRRGRWPDGSGRALAGVSSFGFGGTNAHVVLEGVDGPREAVSEDEEDGARLLVLSSHTEAALALLAERYLEWLASDAGLTGTRLSDLCFTAATRRTQREHRLSITGRSREEFVQALEGFVRGERSPAVARGVVPYGRRPKLALVFSGQTPVYRDMGRELFEQAPVFRATMERCDAWLREHAGWSVLEEIAADESRWRLEQTEICHPVLFSLQISLARLLESWGVVPHAVVGHSMGEITAACAAGVLSLDAALRLIVLRARLLQETSGRGRMAAVALSIGEAEALVAPFGDRLVVAGHNGPTSTVLSGDVDALDEALCALESRQVFFRRLAGEVAGHSPLVDVAGQELHRRLGELQPSPARVKLFSTTTGRLAGDGEFGAAYWGRNVRERVRFVSAIEAMLEDGCDVFLELSSHPVLAAPLAELLAARARTDAVITSLERDRSATGAMLRAAGALYATGQPLDMAAVFPGGRTVSLPRYVWQRERCWTAEATTGARKAGALSTPEPGEQAPADECPSDWLYELEWRPAPRRETPRTVAAAGPWLVFADEQGVGAELARGLSSSGEPCVVIRRGDAYEEAEGGLLRIRPTERDDVRRMLDAALAGPRSCRGVVHLWSLDAPLRADLTVEELEDAQALGCESVISAVQEITGLQGADPPRFWLVTRGAQSPQGTSAAPAVAQAPLWGLGRVLEAEHPELWGGLVDLDPEASAADSAEQLCAEILRGDGEDQTAWRAGARFAARLAPAAPRAAPVTWRFRPDGCYLITGGLGDLGLLVARWMVGQGARRLILMSRTALPPRQHWLEVQPDTPAARQIASVRALESLGASVHLAAVDVGDEVQLRQYLAGYQREGWPPIRGVCHAAGVLRDAVLLDLDAKTLGTVFRPKLRGSWLLHQLLADQPLDFFVLFSSAAALLGQRGQGNYAAASAFLDALAHFRRAQGLPALSLDWAPWSDLGFAVTSGGQRLLRRLTGAGIGSLLPQQGLAALAEMLGRDVPVAVVLPVDWQKLAEAGAAISLPRLLTGLARERGADATPAGRPARRDAGARAESLAPGMLAIADADERLRAVLSHVRRRAAGVLGLPEARLDVDRPLIHLGLDSLMSVELKNWVHSAFGVNLAVGALLQGPTVAELAGQVSARLGVTGAAGSAMERPSIPRIPRDGVLPLSSAQLRMWLLDQLTPGNSVWTVPGAIRVRGRLDAGALESALNEILRRHEILRTTFPAVDGHATQRIAPARRLRLDVTDLAGVPPEGREAAALRLAGDEAQEPFDLGVGPLVRARLLRLDDDDHVILLNMHHIVTDGLSMAIVMRELGALYAAAATGRAAGLPELPVQYVDYAQWQREGLDSATVRAQLEYWTAKLSDRPPVLEFPADRRRLAQPQYRGAVEYLSLPRGLYRSLRELGQREGSTLFVTMLAAFKALVSRYTGREDLVVGTVAASRNHPELEQMIGLFINNLVLRTDLSGDPPFREVLRRVRQTAQEAFANQDVPFEMVLDACQVARDPSHTPLFQIMVATGQAPRLDLPGLTATYLPLDRRRANFDLTFWMSEEEDELRASIEYNTDLFDASTVKRLLATFRGVLEGVVADPGTRLSALPVPSDAERTRVLREWNETRCDYAAERCLHRLIEQQVARCPDAVAVVFEDQSLTYRELDRRGNQLARRLGRLGVGPGVLVGICMERSLEMVVGLLGILKAGGAYLPLDPAYPVERLAFMLDDSGVPVLLTQERLLASLPARACEVLCLDAGWEAIAREPADDPARRVSPDDLAYAIFTSGSTGRPKGALNTHAGITNRLVWMQAQYRLTPDDRVLQKTPFTFDVSVWEFFWPLLAGARLVVARPGGHQDPAYLVRLIREQQISTLHFVPSMLRAFLDAPGLEGCTSIERVICSGEALAFELAESFFDRLPGPALHNLYGPTEASIDVTCWECKRGAQDWTVPIGRPIANTQIYLLDGYQQPVPIGVPGELHIGGVGLARGYLNRPDLTAEKFIPDAYGGRPGARLYRTGDLARYRPDGSIEYLGRLDHQVKLRGFRIELGEIEAVLCRHPAVREAAVLLREDEQDDRRLVAYLAPATDSGPEPSAALSISSLRRHLMASLPEHMIPSGFVILDALPLTASGKVDRRALPAPALTRPDLEVGFAAPRSGAEEILAAMWAAVLRREAVGVHDNFFELGGDSILAIQIIARANREGLRLSPMQFFAHQTIAELAAVAGTAAAVPAEQGLVTGAVPLMPYQRWFFERQLPDAHHWNIAVLVELQERVDLDAMQRAITHLLVHHDALRLRFDRQGAGWHQHNAGAEAAWDAAVLSRVDLSHLPEAEQEQAYERVAAELQAGLDLAEGPVIRVGHFDRGGERRSRMLFVIHHMAVDGISWRILLEDLEVIYRHLLCGEPAALPAKTTSFQRWAEQLTEYVETGALDGELGHWADTVGARVPSLPRDLAGGANTQASARSIALTLGAEDTRALLHEVPRAYNTQINDVLLTALAMTFAPWTESPRLLIELEGHGREQLRDDLDLSRTVGCFTALFPVLLELDSAVDPGRALRSIKEQLRRMPNHGIGYGLLRYVRNGEDGRERLRAASAAEVSFIYLGQFDQVVARSSLFGVARGAVGPIRSARQTRAYVLDVLGQVLEGRLHIEWTYSDNLHRPSTVEALAERFMGALTAIIRHCRQAGVASYTPSDVPYAGLDQEALDRCLAAAAATRAGSIRDVIEDVYALSSTQQGMLFHTLLAPASGVYCNQILVTLLGPLDVRALERAWESVAQRFPVLRSAVRWEELDHPVQIVYRRAPIPLARKDWRSVPPAEWEARFEEYLREDRRRGIDLSAPPLMRLTLVELADTHYELIWTDHHLLLDAWSGALVLREVIEHYRAFCRGEELSLPPRRPYRDFIAWLAKQDVGRAQIFWRDLLRGFTAPTTPRMDQAPASLPASEEHFGRGEVRLTAAETEALRAWAKERHLSLNTMLEGAWALLLSHESGRDDVVFGTVVAGRPAELIGVESMVGLFINTLPMRVRVSADEALVGWLQRLQHRHVEMQQYEYSSLTDIQGWSEVPRGTPLFESIFGFENLAVDPSVGALQREIEIANVRLVDWNSYPLSVAITPDPDLILALKYDSQRFAASAIGLLLDQYRALLVAMSGEANPRLGDLLARLAEVARARRRRSEARLDTVSRDKLRSTRRRVVDPTGAAG